MAKSFLEKSLTCCDIDIYEEYTTFFCRNSLESSPLFQRILEKGFKIKAVFIDYDAVSVDDKETLLYVRDKMKFDSIFKTYSKLAQRN